MKKFFLIFVLLCMQSMASEQNAKPAAATIYDLRAKFHNTNNKPSSIAVAKGSYTLMAMVYTSCPHACPMTIHKIKSIDSEFQKAGVQDLKIVLVSFDVKKDTPKNLKKYQAASKLEPEKWILLSSDSEADARELAVTLGISFKDLGDGDFSHSNVITLLDSEGVVLESINNLNAPVDKLVAALKLDKEKAKTTPTVK